MFHAPKDPLVPKGCTEYLKFYKNGIVEWASDWLIVKSYIDWKKMAACIFSLTKKILVYYKSINLYSPLHIGIALTNIQGCCIALDYFNRISKMIETDMFTSTDILLQKHSDYNPIIYKRFLDDLFNALGLSGCPIYKDEQTLKAIPHRGKSMV
jgi:hypothetical protein